MKIIDIVEGEEKNEIQYEDKDGNTELPELIFNKLRRKVRDGAKDYKKEWKNSLELVDWALNELNIIKPNLSSPRWDQYKELISIAVAEMKKARNSFGTMTI
jgi:hypothetical protein